MFVPLFLPNQNIKDVYPNKENVFIVPKHKKNDDYYKNVVVPFDGPILILRNMEERKAFIAKPKH